MEKWDSYYYRTQKLPPPESMRHFLSYLPNGATVLDFGCGSGRWSAGFQRDRPDISIDALDRNIEHTTLIEENARIRKIKSDFETFIPDRTYFGIWSFASLFFLETHYFAEIMSRLTEALERGGILQFTMVEPDAKADNMQFFGMTQGDSRQLLQSLKLEVLRVWPMVNAAYGTQKIVIPTYSCRARKL